MIPESRSLTFNLTWIRPVTQPASAPAPKARNKVSTGFTPAKMAEAVNAAPIGKVLSTDRSGKSSIL